SVRAMEECLRSACNASMQARKAHRNHHAPVYWWNEAIAEARRACLHASRAYQRSRGSSMFVSRQANYRAARRQLKKSIRESKRKCFLELCDSADRDPYGKAYQIVVKRVFAGRQGAPTDPAELQRIVETLFPSACDAVQSSAIRECEWPVVNISIDEVVNAAASLKTKKAPGPDGIPNRALKLALCLRPDAFAKLYSSCIAEGIFPATWKEQHLVL
ncbi:hypothetical protein KR222_006017, partial [Zaprionus bogoriensis]